MLNMIVPFSQETASASLKRSGKGSDGEDADDSGRKQGGPQDTTKSQGKKRKHEKNAIEGSIGATEMEEKALANANRAFKIAFHDSKIGAPDKLFWHERKKKRVKMIHPVRVVPREETVGLALRDWNDEKECPIQYIQFPHSIIKGGAGRYDIVSKRSLSPYYGKGEVSDQWCQTKFEHYSKQLKRSHRGLEAVDLKTEESFLLCVLQKSLGEGEQEKKLAEVDEAVPEEISTTNKAEGVVENDSEEEDDYEEPRRTRRLSRRSTIMQEKKEPLRPGDRIEYYNQQCVAGDPSGLCQATILFIDPAGDRILTIDDAFTNLQPDHQVKRIQRIYRGTLKENDGQFRAINQYTLKREGDPDALSKVVARSKVWGEGVIQRTQDKMIAKAEKDGFCPKDMIRK